MIAVLAQADGLPIRDNNWLDEFRIPVGDWFTQTVNWVDANLGWLLDAIKWPFAFLFSVIMNDNPSRDSIMSISWLWIVLGFFVLGSVVRNIRIGFMSAALVAFCGVLGQSEFESTDLVSNVLTGGYWFQTSRTFGMIFVSVFLCFVVGLPLGILCGRIDSVWKITRPVLDAMQVIHPFVWMLPFIFFWGLGDVSATMVTMIFAMPPLVRLTNLGIRQVPEDVVEASRAFGANELRVLTDVQLPLARPAVMTGLNQTLLLVFSMLGIAALMGADGLGKLIFRAINNLDAGLAAGAGLAFFLVAVVLDRISQPEADDGLNLYGRIRQAWADRSDPEAAFERTTAAEQAAALAAPAPQSAEPAERPVPVSAAERSGLLAMAGGSIVAMVGVLLAWSVDSGIVSAWGRATDLSFVGTAKAGISGNGGSGFGLLALVFSAVVFFAALRPLVKPPAAITTVLSRIQGALLAFVAAYLVIALVLNNLDSHIEWLEMVALSALGVVALLVAINAWIDGGPRLGVDGALIAAMGALGVTGAFMLVQQPALAVPASIGIGAWISLIGTGVAVIGGLLALGAAPYAAHRPLPRGFSLGAAVGVLIGLGLIYAGSTAAWFVDERTGYRNREFFRGMTDNGPWLGWPTFLIGVVGAVLALATLCGLIPIPEGLRWRASTITAGIGTAVVAIPLAFAITIGWVGDTDYYNDESAVSGAGVLLAMIGGFVILATGRSTLRYFRRRKIYADLAAGPVEQRTMGTTTARAELVGAGADA